MDKKLLKKFVSVTEQIKILEDQRDILKEMVLKEMRSNKIEKAETTMGIFTIAKRLSWQYSEAVAKIKEKLKLTEIREQNSGVAKSSVTEYIRFTFPKEN